MLKKFRDLLRYMFIKLKCSMCCRSNCTVQIGKESNDLENKSN
jgi:hypothetical protein